MYNERIWTKQGQNVAKYDTSNQIQPLILPLEKFIALCYPHVPEIPTYLFINMMLIPMCELSQFSSGQN